MEKQHFYYPPNSFRICVDRREKDIEGRIYSPLVGEVFHLSTISQLFIYMDKIFDACGYPQGFQDKRSFSEGKNQSNLYKGIPKPKMDSCRILKAEGKIGTLDIIVEARKNTSWQGYVKDPQTNSRQVFSGDIELFAVITDKLYQAEYKNE